MLFENRIKSKFMKTALKSYRNLFLGGCAVLAGLLGLCTVASLGRLPASLQIDPGQARKPQLLDRARQPISVTYRNRWNVHETVPLHQVPAFLQRAFIFAEDKRFYRHHGVDWTARLHALVQNLRAGRALRGASTISEQVVRLVIPRPRSLWSRWVEGFDAIRLERLFSKNDILEFYLNQIPYAANRRGVVQAARYYFDRDLGTLNQREMLTLAILVRAPSRLDPYRGEASAEAALRRIARRMHHDDLLSAQDLGQILGGTFQLAARPLDTEADHFIRFVLSRNKHDTARLWTTLDTALQRHVAAVMRQRIQDLGARNINHGAALAVDHSTNEVLAWVSVEAPGVSPSGRLIDTVTRPRQPGSALKPFLYALALDGGMTAATLIDDAPLAESVGSGLHNYDNYSRRHYGLVTLREALGNSLNIPAVKVLQQVGAASLLAVLRRAGITSLTAHPDIYGDGLALGNGEISLFQLVQAYTVLARQGWYQALAVQADEAPREQQRVFSAEASSLIADILSDPDARRLEFGSGGVLRFPVQTAVKTGTSTDYRDSWAIGFNHRYTVGVWMGNLNRTATDRITGATGPALALRAIFAELNRRTPSKPLFLSPRLLRRDRCREQRARADCSMRPEWFLPGTTPAAQVTSRAAERFAIERPTDGLALALDPRLPREAQVFDFQLGGGGGLREFEWYLNGERLASTAVAGYAWRLERGKHSLKVRARASVADPWRETGPVRFTVK